MGQLRDSGASGHARRAGQGGRSRTRSLTPAEILTHLEHRLDLLVRPRRRGRHRSLDAAIAWSHERLPEPTRLLFDRLGVFAGRFTAETAQAVAASGADLLHVVDQLDQLVAQSLLTVRREAGRSWYGLLDTLVSGRPAAAATSLGRALEAFVRIGHVPHLLATLRWIAALVLRESGRGAAAALLATSGIVRTPTAEVLERAWLDPLLDGAGAGGRAVPLAEAVALARVELAALAGAPAEPSAPVPDRFALDGAIWTISFAGRTVRLPDSTGLRDLATLLARPAREVHSTELLGAAVEQPDTGEVLDAQARRRYEARIVELQGILDEAEQCNDRGRADAASLELDLLVDQLAAARGLGGRARRTGGTTERARTAVTWRIRSAIRRLDEVHPALGRHLRAAVRTGTWCSYQPEHPVAWQLDG